MAKINSKHCPLFPSEQRLFDCLNNWVQAKQSYFNPDSFRFNLNNCIQSLRNVTFILQSNKSRFIGFDGWYKTWQDKMRKDPILRWLVEARNHIVKEGDLITKSMVRFTVVESWFDSPIFEVEAPLFTKLEESSAILAQKAPKDIDLTIGLLKIERRWVDSKLPDHELLEALSHAFLFLEELLHDAHQKLLSAETLSNCSCHTKDVPGENRVIPCMLAQEWDRSLWMNLRDGALLTPSTTKIPSNEELLIKARDKYAIGDITKLPMDSFKNQAKAFFESAKMILKTDGYHVPIAIIGYPNKTVSIQALHMTDRADKHILLRKLAADIERTGATSVILINEAWMSKSEHAKLTPYELEAPDRKEALQLLAANSKGDVFSYLVYFDKDKNGKVSLGKEIATEKEVVYMLEPILAVWRKLK